MREQDRWRSGRKVSQAQGTASAKARDRTVLGIFEAGAERVRGRVVETKSAEGRLARVWQAF